MRYIAAQFLKDEEKAAKVSSHSHSIPNPNPNPNPYPYPNPKSAKAVFLRDLREAGEVGKYIVVSGFAGLDENGNV